MLGSYNMRTVGWAAVSTELHFASLHTQQILVHSTQCSVHTEYSTVCLYECWCVCVQHLPLTPPSPNFDQEHANLLGV